MILYDVYILGIILYMIYSLVISVSKNTLSMSFALSDKF